MSTTTIFRTENSMLTLLISLEPYFCIHARDDVIFDTEIGEVKTVDNVIGSHNQSNRDFFRNDEFPDRGFTVVILKLPEPLLADHFNIIGTFRRIDHPLVDDPAQGKNKHD